MRDYKLLIISGDPKNPEAVYSYTYDRNDFQCHYDEYELVEFCDIQVDVTFILVDNEVESDLGYGGDILYWKTVKKESEMDYLQIKIDLCTATLCKEYRC